VPTATAARSALIAQRAEIQSEQQDLHSELERLNSNAPLVVGAAECCFHSARDVEEEISRARNNMRRVDRQVAALDEWLASEKAKSLVRKEICVECPGCAQLAAKVAALEQEAATRQTHEDAALEAFSLSLRRCEREVATKGQELADAQAQMRKKVSEAEAAREAWAAEKAKRIATAEEQRAVVVGELPALRDKVERAVAHLQGLEDEIFSLRNEYRLVGELSLKVLKTVEDDRKQVQQAVEPWQKEEGTHAMRHATTRLDMVEASKAEVDAKLERAEKRLTIAEAAQLHNLEPKIDALEHTIQKVQKHEHELHEIIKTNTTRLDQIDVQCHKVNKWMMALTNPGGNDVFDGVEHEEPEEPQETQAEPHHEHHHHHHEHNADA
jgi:chromosome segregation ATPase